MRTLFRYMALTAALLIGNMQQVWAAGSGFIENMPSLTADADRPGAMIWTKEGFDRTQYTKVMIEPVTVFIADDSKYKGLDADELKAMADGFREALTKTLEPDVPVVSQPGAGVLYVRAAITNVHMAKKKRGLLGYTPVGFVVTAAQDAAGARVSLKNAVVEMELLDAQSNERLGVLVDKTPTTADKKELSWDSITATFDYYANRFKSRLHAAPGK
ncbi:MAG: DUF3313 domain-containing protein [Gammaproteobacteria bacterium]